LASPAEIAAAGKAGRSRSFWSAWLHLFQRGLMPDTTPVVRVAPGTHLRINSVPDEIALEFGVNPLQEVTFVRLESPACLLRDAVRFYHGRHVLLQRFKEGVSFQVLTDGSSDRDLDLDPQETNKLEQPAPSGSGVCGRVG